MIPNAWQGFNFGLGEDIDMLRDTTRSFSDDKIAPRADEIDKTNTFPRDLWPQMGALGLHGITVEEEYGGSGLGYLAHCVAMEEISRGSASVGLSYGAHSNLCVNQIRRTGSDAQPRRQEGRPLHPQRLEILDHQRAGGRDPGGLCQDRPRRRRPRHYRIPG